MTKQLSVSELGHLWRGVLDGFCANGADPIDATEAMLAEALRAKLQIDGPRRVAAAMTALVRSLEDRADALDAARSSAAVH